MRRPDAARPAGGQAGFQSSLAYRSTLRFSFKPPSLASAALAFLGANGPPNTSQRAREASTTLPVTCFRYLLNALPVKRCEHLTGLSEFGHEESARRNERFSV